VILLDDLTGHVRLGLSRHDADREVLSAALRDALAAASKPLTRQEWLDTVDGRRQDKWQAQNALIAGMGITVAGAGTKNEPKRYSITLSHSRSPVPSIDRERESHSSSSSAFPKDSAADSRSRVPTQEHERSLTPNLPNGVVPERTDVREE